MDAPVLSVVVAIVSDTTEHPNADHLEACLEALQRQSDAPPTEIIVPWHPLVDGIAQVRLRYPEVRFLEVTDLKTYRAGSREHHDELRARGLAAATGSIVALIEDHGVPAPDWSAKIVEAHGKKSYVALGGAIENGIDRPLNWAVYYCDFLRYQNPVWEGESGVVSDANVSYKRPVLESVRHVWREIFHETSVSNALRAEGHRLALDGSIVVYQHRLHLRAGSALKERFVWGRSYAATRAGLASPGRRWFWAVFAPALPLLMMARMTLMARQKRRTFAAFVKASPLTAALVVGWSCGELIGYVTGRANAAGAPAAEAIARGSRTAP